MNVQTDGSLSRSFVPITVAMMMVIGVMSAPLMAQSDTDTQTNEVVVPTFWYIQADSDTAKLSNTDYLNNNSSKVVQVADTDWNLIANNQGSTEVEFTVNQNFTNVDDNTITRDVQLQIDSGTGDWSGASSSKSTGSNASVSYSFSNNLSFGTVNLDVSFVHETNDQPKSADSEIEDTASSSAYYAPAGKYLMKVTGTISAP